MLVFILFYINLFYIIGIQATHPRNETFGITIEDDRKVDETLTVEVDLNAFRDACDTRRKSANTGNYTEYVRQRYFPGTTNASASSKRSILGTTARMKLKALGDAIYINHVGESVNVNFYRRNKVWNVKLFINLVMPFTYALIGCKTSTRSIICMLMHIFVCMKHHISFLIIRS